MATVNIHKAKTQLSRLVEQAVAGEEVVIAKAGKPKVRLVPVLEARARVPGGYRDEIVMDDSFFEPLPDDEVSAWEDLGGHRSAQG